MLLNWDRAVKKMDEYGMDAVIAAAPGMTACESTSPSRLIRRSKSRIPIGPLASASAIHAASAIRMKPKPANGPNKKFPIPITLWLRGDR